MFIKTKSCAVAPLMFVRTEMQPERHGWHLKLACHYCTRKHIFPVMWTEEHAGSTAEKDRQHLISVAEISLPDHNPPLRCYYQCIFKMPQFTSLFVLLLHDSASALEHGIQGNLWYQAMATEIWLQNKLSSLIPFGVRDVLLYGHF